MKKANDKRLQVDDVEMMSDGTLKKLIYRNKIGKKPLGQLPTNPERF